MNTSSDANCLILVAHAPLATALREVALHVYPECEVDVVAVDVQPHWSTDEVQTALANATERVTHRSRLYLVDVAGATPANALKSHLQHQGTTTAVVAGVNVPMLWRVLAYRQESLDNLVERALTGGPMGICQLTLAG